MQILRCVFTLLPIPPEVVDVGDVFFRLISREVMYVERVKQQVHVRPSWGVRGRVEVVSSISA